MASPGEEVSIFTYPYLSAGAPSLGEAKGLIQWEEILEFTNLKFIESNYKQEMKRKPGRPKANKNIKKDNQMMIENFFQN